LSIHINLYCGTIINVFQRNFYLFRLWFHTHFTFIRSTTSTSATSHEHIQNVIHPTSTSCTFFNSIHAMFVIDISFFPIKKNIIGFLYFFEFFRISTFIGMVFNCELAICFFNIIHGSVFFNS